MIGRCSIRAARQFAFANFAGCGNTVHLGHLDIHENEVKGPAVKKLHGFAAVTRQRDAMATFLEETDNQPLVYGVSSARRIERPWRREDGAETEEAFETWVASDSEWRTMFRIEPAALNRLTSGIEPS